MLCNWWGHKLVFSFPRLCLWAPTRSTLSFLPPRFLPARFCVCFYVLSWVLHWLVCQFSRVVLSHICLFVVMIDCLSWVWLSSFSSWRFRLSPTRCAAPVTAYICFSVSLHMSVEFSVKSFICVVCVVDTVPLVADRAVSPFGWLTANLLCQRLDVFCSRSLQIVRLTRCCNSNTYLWSFSFDICVIFV